jgi:hypothetical protein
MCAYLFFEQSLQIPRTWVLNPLQGKPILEEK